MNIYHNGDFNQNVFDSISTQWYENYKDIVQIFKIHNSTYSLNLNVKYENLLNKCLFPYLFYLSHFLLIFKAKVYSSIVVIHLMKQLTYYLLQRIKQMCHLTNYANFFFSFIWTLHLSQKPLPFRIILRFNLF